MAAIGARLVFAVVITPTGRVSLPPEDVVCPCGVDAPGSDPNFTCTASAGPSPGEFTWHIDGSDQSSPSFLVSEVKEYSVSVTYTYTGTLGEGSAKFPGGSVQGFQETATIEGGSEGYVDVGGPRKEIQLALDPSDIGDFRQLTLSVDGQGLALYREATGGTAMTQLQWNTGALDNWGDRPSSVWAEATQTGEKHVTATVSASVSPDPGDTYSGESSASVTLIACDCGLKSVTFSSATGGGFHSVYVDTTGDAYGSPQWEDNSDANGGHLDGDAEDWDANPADQQYPVCYESGKKIKATVLFLADPEEEFEDATIEGFGPEGMDFQPTEVTFTTIGGKSYAYADIESTDPLCNAVDWLHPLEITWTLRSGDRVLVEKSANEVFVTLAAPQCAKLYRTVAYLACGNAGATDADTALAQTWDMFSTGSGPAKVCAWDEETRQYDRKLYYWLFVANPESLMANTTAQLLQEEHGTNGTCHAWVDLFHQALLVNQTTPTEIVTAVQALGWGDIIPQDYDCMIVVNRVEWSDEPDYPSDAPWIYSYDDMIRTPAGKPGQNTPTPARKVFYWHFVTQHFLAKGEEYYYDPSYGIKATSAADYTSQAVAGWGRLLDDNNMHFKPVEEDESIVFDPIGW